MMQFDLGYLYVTPMTMDDDDADADLYTAYLIDESTESVNEQRFVTSFSLRKFSMLTEETISSTTLDTAALWTLSGLAMPLTVPVVLFAPQPPPPPTLTPAAMMTNSTTPAMMPAIPTNITSGNNDNMTTTAQPIMAVNPAVAPTAMPMPMGGNVPMQKS
jgi:hypothetical protein